MWSFNFLVWLIEYAANKMSRLSSIATQAVVDVNGVQFTQIYYAKRSWKASPCRASSCKSSQ